MEDIRTYYEEAVYFNGEAMLKQLREAENLKGTAGVKLGMFDIAQAKLGEDYAGEGIEDYMYNAITNMVPGDLCYVKTESVGVHNIGTKLVDVTGTVAVPESGKKVSETIVVDDDGNIHGNMSLADIKQRMKNEAFAKAYFICEPDKVTKVQPVPVANEDDDSLKMEVFKFAVFGQI